MASITLLVGGMTCAGCVAAVTRAIRRVDAAAGIVADLASGRITVASERPPRDLAAAVEQAGFSAAVG